VEQHPDCAVCWNNLGLALARLEQYDSAIEAYDRAVELNSSYMEPWNNRGIAMVLGYEDVAGALQSFDRAIQIDPRSVEAWVNKANALDMADRGPEAQEAREKAKMLGYQG